MRASVALGALAFWFGFLLVLLWLFSGCAESMAEPGTLEHRFTVRPVQLVVSSEFSDECAPPIADAVEWLRERGATWAVRVANPATTPVLNGIWQSGVIAMTPGSPSMRPGQIAHGETEPALTIGGNVYAARVTLASCDKRVVAHELGHALGLPHRDVTKNLMHSQLPLGGWGLDDDQLRWVADP